MDGLDTFQSYLLQEARLIVMPITKLHMEELGQTFYNELFDLEGKRVVDRNLSQKERFFGVLFYRFNEICKSYLVLEDIEVYIGKFPYSKNNISKVRNLHYNIANYINEVYILKERLSAYLTKIGRLYKKDRRHKMILRSTRPIFEMVSNTLSGITTIRGIHVHQSRYTDKDLERLSTLELLVQNGSLDFFDQFPDFYESEYRNIRQKWKKIVKQNNKALRELFDIYFGSLLTILFDKNGKLIYPRNMSNHR